MSQIAVARFAPPSMVDGDPGLCTTCIHRDACGLRAHSETPVVFCEEFTPVETPIQRTFARFAPRLRPVPDLCDETVSDEWIGLCKSCANRDDCTLRKPVGGVWHCEEFA